SSSSDVRRRPWWRRRAVWLLGGVTVAGGLALLVGSALASGTPPSAPATLTGSAAVTPDGYVKLTWTAPASPGDSAINAYGYDKSNDAGANWTAVTPFTSTPTALTQNSGPVPGLLCKPRTSDGCM